MLFWLGLVTGLILGWVIEWFIDWRFWRRELYASLQTESQWRRELQAAQREVAELRTQLAQLSASAPAGETSSVLPNTADLPQDQLEVINGVDPAFAQRLHMAGVYTFAQLSELSPERLLEIIHPEPGQAVDPGAWIAQARQLAQKNQ
jgi:predicted flap endonuclease-1-like 5' DNA nuclease